MDEIAPGLFHWSAHHDGIGTDVHSHLHAASGTLFDPMEPPEGLEWFERTDHVPQRIVLSNRHHRRHCLRYVERFGVRVLVHEAGLHAYAGDDALDPVGFAFGDELAPGVTAHEVGVLTPEETALQIDAGDGALLLADSVMRDGDGALAFVPDGLLGDDPEGIKAGLRERLAELAETLEWDALLLAHGSPAPAGGRRALLAFARE